MACKPCKEKSPCEELDLGCVPKVKDTCVELNKLIEGLPLPLGTDYNTVVTYLLGLINNIEVGESTGIDHITSSLTGNTTTVYLWADSAEEELIGSFVVTNGTDGSDGADGADGQTIDHTSFTSSSLGGVAGQQGAVDTYTVWGDSGETLNLGTFTVYNGADGLDATESTSTKFFFGTNLENPNDATAGTPLIDYSSTVVYNTTTIIPPTKSVYFNTNTKEIWTFNGTTWDNTTSIGNHLLRTEFDLIYGDALPGNETLLHSFTLPTNIEVGERIRARYIGSIKHGTYLIWRVYDGVSEDDLGKIVEGVEGQWNGDIETALLEVQIDITRKSDTKYYSSIFGGLRLLTISNQGVLHTLPGLYIPLINNLQIPADTTTPMTIRLYGYNTISQANTINLQEISFEKIKY